MCIEAILCNISAVLLRHSVDMSSAIISTVEDRRSVALSQMRRKCAPQVRSDRRKTINDFICHFIKYRTHLAATYNKKNIYKRMTIQTQLEFRMLTSTLAKNTGKWSSVKDFHTLGMGGVGSANGRSSQGWVNLKCVSLLHLQLAVYSICTTQYTQRPCYRLALSGVCMQHIAWWQVARLGKKICRQQPWHVYCQLETNRISAMASALKLHESFGPISVLATLNL